VRGALTASAVVLSAAVLLAAGWGLAHVFESPQQREALASPPPPGVVTAEVKLGDLVDQVAVNVDVIRAAQLEVPLTSATGPAVVTARPVADGGAVEPLHPVLEVNGRPLLLITGAFPMYRELSEGVEGSDVRQLQAALKAAGYVVTVDGRFGAGTARALDRAYRDLGYEPPGPLPASEIVVVPRLPAQLVRAPDVGAAGEGATALVSAGRVVASADLPDAVAQRLEIGMPAELKPVDGDPVRAQVASVGIADPESGLVRVTFSPEEGSFPDALLGETLLATIELEVVAPGALLVPSVALSPRGTDDPVVVRVGESGESVEVRVRELATLGGVSAIEPVHGDELEAGDRVVVG
jgi:hypothetical protein